MHNSSHSFFNFIIEAIFTQPVTYIIFKDVFWWLVTQREFLQLGRTLLFIKTNDFNFHFCLVHLCVLMDELLTKPVFTVCVTKTIFAVTLTRIKINWSIETFLYDNLTTTIRCHITTHLDWRSILGGNCINTIFFIPKMLQLHTIFWKLGGRVKQFFFSLKSFRFFLYFLHKNEIVCKTMIRSHLPFQHKSIFRSIGDVPNNIQSKENVVWL